MQKALSFCLKFSIFIFIFSSFALSANDKLVTLCYENGSERKIDFSKSNVEISTAEATIVGPGTQSAFAGSAGNILTGYSGSPWSPTSQIDGPPDGVGGSAFMFSSVMSTFPLAGYDFGLTIPCNATITDLRLSVTRRNIGDDNIQDQLIALRLPDFTIAAGNEAMAIDWIKTTTSWETVMYNDPSWGTVLTPDILNDPRFGVVIIAQNVEMVSGARPEIDALELTVCYEVIGEEYQEIEYAVTKTNATCGEANADITIDAMNGSGSYEYSLDAGGTWQNSNTFSGLGPGPYLVTIRNQDGTCQTSTINCTVGAGTTILQPGDALVTCKPVNGDPATLIVERTQQLNTFYSSGFQGREVSDLIEPKAHIWTAAQLGGQIFSVATDDDLNIYAATSSLYSFINNANAIVTKIDGQTGAISQLATLPGVSGLAGIHYQEGCDQIFTINLDDGIIYRLDGASGAVLSTFDPLGADDGIDGKAPLGERLLALDYNYAEDKLYYSVWSNDEIDNGTVNSIRSVSIDPTTCDFLPATDALEFNMPFLADLCGDPDHQYSMPVADLEFSPDGQTMLIAEAGFDSTNSSNQAHQARVLEYNGSTGSWTVDSAPNGGTTNGCKYAVGLLLEENNARGGIDFGNSGFSDGCTIDDGDFAIFTVDGVFGTNCAENCAYGLQYVSTNGGGPSTSVALDIDRLNNSNVKSVYGDVDMVSGCYDLDPVACLEYDLAVTQTVTSTGPYFPGSTVTYDIVVENEGGLLATGIDIANITPTDLMYVSSVSDPNVTDNGNGTFTVANIPGGGTQIISVTYMVSFGSTATSLTSNVQITADDGDDIDSDPATDETVDEDGDGDGDDDDEDPETIVIDHYDLELTKTVNSTPPFAQGDVISYIIRVDNDGTVPANNIEVTDSGAAGLIFQSITADANVVDNLNGTFTIPTIQAGSFQEIEIFFQIDPTTMETSLSNLALITADDGDDEDSDPDQDETVDEDGDGDPDDDDEDIATITIAPYDLSLVKNLTSTGPYGPGSIVTFQIIVSNDGSIAANNIEVTDAAPADLVYQGMTADANVTDNANGTFTIGTIPVSDSQIIEVNYQIASTFAGSSLTNIAQITADDGVDGDSNPDEDETVDEDGDGDPFDDDEDEAEVSIAPYDLSLVKNLTSAGPYMPSSMVTFQIVVSNDGSLVANGIEVTDAAPADLIYQGMTADGNVTDNANGTFTIGMIPVSGNQIIEVTYQISPTFTGTSLTNIAQITADDGIDSDSNPDEDETVDEDGDGDPFDDDEDDVVVNVGQVYDLSLDKVLTTTGTIMPGSAVTFQITVSNDGTLPASGIEVTENAPADLAFQNMTANANVTDNGNGTFTIANIPVGGTETIELNYILSTTFAGNSLTNIAQITADDGDDMDSDPDEDETVDEDGDGDPFDDDEDDAVVPVGQPYDLSLTKELTTTGIIMPGDFIDFRITVSNDGGLPAAGIVVTDSAPADLIYQGMTAAANVTDNVNGTFTIANIPVGGSEIIDLSYQVSTTFTGMILTNLALITTDDGDDIDSNPDDDETVDEDGDGDPFDDDEDEAMVMIGQVYDLSLTKVYTTTGPVGPGSTVTFDITVSNDGTLPATGIEVTESAPADLIYQGITANANVTDNGNGTFTITSLPVGTTEVISISYQISPNFTGTGLTNIAQITADDGDDMDSDPDDDETVDDDGDGDPFDDDEDFSDIPVVQIYDLSLTKNYITQGPIGPGSTVSFEITVSNDGTLPAAGIVVTDDSPADLIYSGFTGNANIVDNGDGTFTVISLPVGSSAVIILSYQISPTFTGTSISNLALITTDDGDDIDSNPDDDETVDEDGDGDPFDDDEDEADVPVGQVYDLSMTKTLTTPTPISPGDIISFDITVVNSGTLPAAGVVITDSAPADLIFQSMTSNANVADNGNGTFTVLNLAAGATEVFELNYQINPNFSGASLTNIAQITEDDGDDVDSSPDDDETVDEDGDGDPFDDDEDDEVVPISIFDLALTLYVDSFTDTDMDGMISSGEDVQFGITIYNQGNVDENNLTITDYIPMGMTLSTNDTNGWTGGPTGNVTNTASVAAGATTTVWLVLTVDNTFMGTMITNWAEISMDSGDDIDSTPDQINNDPFGGTDIIDNSNGDEDDHDDAQLMVGQVYDLALTTSYVNYIDNDASGTLTVGDDIQYNIIVINQGTVNANNIEITEYLPAGTSLSPVDMNGWTTGAGGLLTNNIATVPTTGSGVPIDVIVRVDPSFTGMTVQTWAEISVDDGPDEDSTPDQFNTDPFGGDDIVDNSNGDEDDHDPAESPAVIFPFTSLGDFVWEDIDGDGQQDPGEPGIEGIQVSLYTSAGVLVSTQFTDASGLYEFENVVPGLYIIHFDAPFDMDFTLPNATNNSNNDSNVDNSNGYGTTAVINVGVGAEDFSIDAGLHFCVPIGDLVWLDYNENDQWDQVENGINGMRVNLMRQGLGGDYYLWDYTHTGHKPGTPSDDGYFKFCAPPGTYYLEFIEPPTGLVAAIPNVGSEENDSDVTGVNGPGTTNTFTVLSGQEVCEFGAGYQPMGTIGDFVFMDQNQNGLREAAEPGINNVLVQAYNAEGTLVGEAISDPNGQYEIDYLQKTDVYLKFIAPSNFAATIPNAGAEEVDSDVNHANGFMTTNFYDIQSGEHQANVDAGFISGVVPVEWLDLTVKGNDRSNQLTWSLAMELDVSHYEVERSIENISSFTSIGSVLSNGDSFEKTSYNFEDFDLIDKGFYYYRIKQVDRNGDYSYSEIAVIEVEAQEGRKMSAGIFPNPSNGEFALEIETDAEIDELSFSIYNTNGQLVKSDNQLGKGLESGKHIFIVDDLNLTPGIYNLKLSAGNNLLYKKLLIVRN